MKTLSWALVGIILNTWVPLGRSSIFVVNDKDVEDCSPISARAFSGAPNRVIGTIKDYSDTSVYSFSPWRRLFPGWSLLRTHSAEEIQGDRWFWRSLIIRVICGWSLHTLIQHLPCSHISWGSSGTQEPRGHSNIWPYKWDQLPHGGPLKSDGSPGKQWFI